MNNPDNQPMDDLASILGFVSENHQKPSFLHMKENALVSEVKQKITRLISDFTKMHPLAINKIETADILSRWTTLNGNFEESLPSWQGMIANAQEDFNLDREGLITVFVNPVERNKNRLTIRPILDRKLFKSGESVEHCFGLEVNALNLIDDDGKFDIISFNSDLIDSLLVVQAELFYNFIIRPRNNVESFGVLSRRVVQEFFLAGFKLGGNNQSSGIFAPKLELLF